MTVQPAKTAKIENVLDFDPMITAVFLTQTVPLVTAVVSGPSRSAGNAAMIMTVQKEKTAKTKNVLHLDPMDTHVVPTLTVPLATAVDSLHSRSAGNAAKISTVYPRNP